MSIRKTMTQLVLAAVCAAPGVCRAKTLQPAPDAVKDARSSFDFDLWNQLVKTYVDDKGRVDYARLKANAADARRVDILLAEVGLQKLEALPSKEAKLAFMINAYNVCVWKNVLDRLPGHKDLDGKLKQYNFFYSTDFIVSGKKINLKKLEDDEVRARFKDPRVHMALNCASGGCPQLPNEAFTPDKLNAQLDREAKKFSNEERNVRFDAAKKVVYLSHIFDWYDKDFAPDKAGVLTWINKRRAPDKQIPADAKIEYVDYDWRLNDLSLPR